MFKRLKTKKQAAHQNDSVKLSAKESYREIVSVAKTWIESDDTKEEKIMLLDYLINIVLDDICSSEIMNSHFNEPSVEHSQPFPEYVYANDTEYKTHTGDKIDVNLADVKIYICPWNIVRMRDTLLNISKNDFVYNPNNHFSKYFPLINLCYVYNGNHSITAGSYFKKGKISSSKQRLENIFPHCTTDGENWINVHTQNVIEKVSDFRFAVVYTLAEMKYNISKEQ